MVSFNAIDYRYIRGAIKNNPDKMDISSNRIGRGLMTEKELKSSTL